jgi:uncharacterized protein (TIGR02452 family)
MSMESSLDAAFALQEEMGLRSLVLNLASSQTPGGAVRSGVVAQEECLFRQSSYHQHLNQERVKYPLKRTMSVVTRNVWVVKSAGLVALQVPWQVDFVAASGVRKPTLVPSSSSSSSSSQSKARGGADEGKLSPTDFQTTCDKIRSVLQAAILCGERVLVLGALGCGGFRNPPLCVAKCFQRVLFEEGYIRCFDHVCFALLLASAEDQKAGRVSLAAAVAREGDSKQGGEAEGGGGGGRAGPSKGSAESVQDTTTAKKATARKRLVRGGGGGGGGGGGRGRGGASRKSKSLRNFEAFCSVFAPHLSASG